MKYLITTTLLFSIILYSCSVHGQANIDTYEMDKQESVLSGDLELIIGEWTGTITYLDYSSNKPFTMPANVIVKQGKNENTLVLQNEYPNEPKANNTDKVKVTKNRTHLNKALVTSRTELSNGNIILITKYTGKDDNKTAVIRYTYTLGKTQFTIRKDVQFDNSADWIKRSEFDYNR